MTALHEAIFTMWFSGAREAIGRDPAFPNMEESVSRLFAFMAHYVGMVDNEPDEAIRQIESGSFDLDTIRRKHLKALRLDPAYVANQVVKSIVRGRGFGHRLRELVEISIGRIALKELRRDIGWREKQSWSDISHIADWIASAVASEEAWLSNLDERGRVKKLMKFGSLAAMHAEAEKQMKRKLVAQPVAMVAEEPVFASGDGEYRIVQLTTPAALDRESDAMRHCVGQGAYDRYLGHKDHLLLSLRDKSNRPHVTIQVRNLKIVQFLGKANSTPKLEYRDAALALLEPLGIEFSSASDEVNRHAIWYGEPVEYRDPNMRDAQQNIHIF
ncbi:PcfJ domain-containing protein [Rhizobium sp. BK176]|uniref:PcfJ domain-containing protein n=1 Tax=Rhizobium sp. BK176 TaxID=2587071 RepID=UPI00216805D7|nr:PcfJ domain-containing protein [Rhizobium sp. BK176]MCS4088561.1 hypothetical protein [Rhizobium sp. BK176]